MSEKIWNLERKLESAIESLTEVRAALSALGRNDADVIVEPLGRGESFSFTWPKGPEHYDRVSLWRVTHGDVQRELRLGHSKKRAWGRMRRRTVVFGRAGRAGASTHPWATFVESDDGRMAAVVPDPRQPRRLLREGDPLPPFFAGRVVLRADELFASIASGASLRIIVDDEEGQIRYAAYVARLKGRF